MMRRLIVRWRIRHQIRRDLARMRRLGLVEADGSGWQLTPFGRRMADAQKGS